MESVYVIKVRTKPVLASLYPSERRYSASTVGGLCLIHVIFGSMSLILSGFTQCLQGLLQFLICCAPFVTGLFAWKKWYIDRNIIIFFYANLFSLIASVSCCFMGVIDTINVSESEEFKTTLLINFVILSLMEILWSALSAQIAYRGMTRQLEDTSYNNHDVAVNYENSRTVCKKKPPPPRPDILEHDCGFSSLRLPSPESNQEFRDRVERFLANQNDGSYT